MTAPINSPPTVCPSLSFFGSPSLPMHQRSSRPSHTCPLTVTVHLRLSLVPTHQRPSLPLPPYVHSLSLSSFGPPSLPMHQRPSLSSHTCPLPVTVILRLSLASYASLSAIASLTRSLHSYSHLHPPLLAPFLLY
jgi:hypothetical protein